MSTEHRNNNHKKCGHSPAHMHSTATEWNHIKMFDKLQKEIIGCLLFSNMIVCDRAWSKLQYSIDELKLCSISSLLFFVRTFVSVCVSYENEEEKIIWNWKISMCLKCKHETAQHMFTIGVNIFDRSKDFSNIRTLHMHMSFAKCPIRTPPHTENYTCKRIPSKCILNIDC